MKSSNPSIDPKAEKAEIIPVIPPRTRARLPRPLSVTGIGTNPNAEIAPIVPRILISNIDCRTPKILLMVSTPLFKKSSNPSILSNAPIAVTSTSRPPRIRARLAIPEAAVFTGTNPNAPIRPIVVRISISNIDLSTPNSLLITSTPVLRKLSKPGIEFKAPIAVIRTSIPPSKIAKSAIPLAAVFGEILRTSNPLASSPRPPIVAPRGIRFSNICLTESNPAEAKSLKCGIDMKAPMAVTRSVAPPRIIARLPIVLRTFLGLLKNPVSEVPVSPPLFLPPNPSSFPIPPATLLPAPKILETPLNSLTAPHRAIKPAATLEKVLPALYQASGSLPVSFCKKPVSLSKASPMNVPLNTEVILFQALTILVLSSSHPAINPCLNWSKRYFRSKNA